MGDLVEEQRCLIIRQTTRTVLVSLVGLGPGNLRRRVVWYTTRECAKAGLAEEERGGVKTQRW